MMITLQEVLAARSEGERKLRSAVNALEAKTCADILADACEPRPPKPEWFGTGSGQWDAWAVQGAGLSSGWELCRGIARLTCTGYLVRTDGSICSLSWEEIKQCLPVAREGYPAPVGWQVLEVAK